MMQKNSFIFIIVQWRPYSIAMQFGASRVKPGKQMRLCMGFCQFLGENSLRLGNFLGGKPVIFW